VGEQFGEECARAGEGGADDGDVAFDRGPGCGANVVVCCVLDWVIDNSWVVHSALTGWIGRVGDD
jgi:hypothetical protein